MKKLMVVLGAVAIAACAQAAKIDWKVAADSWTLKSGSAAAAETTVYLIDYTKASSIISALSVDGFEYTEANIKAIAGVIGSSVTSDAKGSVAQNSLTTPSGYALDGTKYDWGYLVIDDTAASGDIYAGIAGSVSKAVYQPGDETYGTTQVAGFNNRQAMNYSLVQAGAVPEPTSGLLLLLGVAGLALKRRRA